MYRTMGTEGMPTLDGTNRFPYINTHLRYCTQYSSQQQILQHGHLVSPPVVTSKISAIQFPDLVGSPIPNSVSHVVFDAQETMAATRVISSRRYKAPHKPPVPFTS
ncbi:hypothetical protein H0G86_013054 [Trichoderma simmonsii]|uniref:Uncharacterized protein n=1 Tax=Trichoderma simmonsii TaxID=1491479 RepID=A0A8G0LPQ7_9HYPO|nr:hypothetical protein H0G86_013054 [Trichoderma simmonsii]